ncbi:uncharacterized protein LOC129738997 isoform X2 [Uranotaenia lowii]|uniref:uncharacterized protein LOC129738997 isoform X2 n=1 Tax=Uranotaenia lowii TaxID=190385 RepID=UPI002478CF5F|nr:uncharacterized protein LOC129738997 isoform X2 [Uranotaenia lowii]
MGVLILQAHATVPRDRTSSSEISSFRWTPARRKLPGKKWGAPLTFTDDYDLELNTAYPGQCLKASIAESHFKANFDDCNAIYPQLCIYKRRTLLALHCPTNEYTTRYSTYQDQCFTVVRSSVAQNQSLLFQVSDHRKYTLYQQLVEKCKAKCNHSLVQHANINASGQLSNYSTIGGDGIMTFSPSIDCVVYERNHSAGYWKTPAINLSFDRAHRRLTMTIAHPRFLWRDSWGDVGVVCYTDADSELLREVKIQRRIWPPAGKSRDDRRQLWDVQEHLWEDHEIYELKLYGDFPGLYWCEGHAVPKFQLIKSDKIVAQKKEADVHIFSVFLQLKVEDIEDFLDKKYFKKLVKGYLDYLKSCERDDVRGVVKRIKAMQVMRVLSVDESQERLELVVHVAAKYDRKDLEAYGTDDFLDREPNDLVRRQYSLKERLRKAFLATSNEQFRFLGINSTEVCLPDSIDEDNLPWPAARIGQTVTPRHLCLIKSSGLPLARKCLGDRTLGGVWQRLQGSPKCTKNLSDHTRRLYNFNARVLEAEASGQIDGLLEEIGTAVDVGMDHLIPADVFYLSQALDNVRGTLSSGRRSDNGSSAIDQQPMAINDGAIKSESFFCSLTAILNRVMYVNESIVLRSQVALNATNILLDSVDDIINQLSVNSGALGDLLSREGGMAHDCRRKTNDDPETTTTTRDRNRRDTLSGGTVLFRTARLILLVTDPMAAAEGGRKISGLALIRNNATSNDTIEEDNFNGYDIRLLSTDESESDLMATENLEIASFVPQELLDKIFLLRQQINAVIDVTDGDGNPNGTLAETISEPVDVPRPPPLKVVITVYFNDHIFRETSNGTIRRAGGKIISVSIPGYGSDLPGELPVLIRSEAVGNGSSGEGLCGFWDFDPVDQGAADDNGMPRWGSRGCTLGDSREDEGLYLCKCSHLTSFSRLILDTQVIETVGISQKYIGVETNEFLDLITTIGCSFSLLGVAAIVLTAFLFPSWRSTANSKILLQLSVALGIEMIVIFLDGPDIDLSEGNNSTEIRCTLLGASLHYIILVTFMWMLVIAYLQFQRYVKVLGKLRPSRCILKATLLSWGLPLVIVLTFVGIDYTLYHKKTSISDICYPHEEALTVGLLVPITIVIIANMTSFVLITYNVFSVPQNLTRSSERDLTVSQLRLSLFLFFLLGLPWIFGMMMISGQIVFAYLFCFTAPLQGFILFIYFILMEPTARKLWAIKLKLRDPKSKNAEMTTTTTTSTK